MGRICDANIIITILLILIFSSAGTGQVKKAEPQLIKWVDPFIGTGGHGHTYPGASYPFGMVQLSPDTRLTGWDGCSGYHDSDRIIYGFSHTHLSGTGVSDYGDILLMPTVGPVQLDNGHHHPDSGYASRFDKYSETASPGYYRVLLKDYGIDVQLTAGKRVGIHHYRFPPGSERNVILDLEHRDPVLASRLIIKSDREVSGMRRSSAWAKDQVVYFVIRFSRGFTKFGIQSDGRELDGRRLGSGRRIKGYFRFPENGNADILVKVGISPVSIKGARKNLDAECSGWDFQKIRRETEAAWEEELSRIVVKGGTPDQRKIFYTALYHSFLNPNLFMDADGQFRGTDLKIHRAEDFTNYTVFSLWDTFRATHPLFTILQRKRTADFIRTMLAQYTHGGQLPVWELAANDTGCMIGYHSIPVIVDAWRKGIRDFDPEKALEAMKASAEKDHLGLKEYKDYGFIPLEAEHESVSKTLEYAYDDWCIAVMARDMGKSDDYRRYAERAGNYKNILDPATGFFRPRFNGGWLEPFDPLEVNFHYTEANGWQYAFFVPHDIRGLITGMGGGDIFERRLDGLFGTTRPATGRKQADITGLIGQYAHGNEPSHHVAYLYNFIGKPWKTQRRVREITETLYGVSPAGLCGNEDCGQMSSWYVFSAMGFYPVTPGSDVYIIGSPIFPEVRLHLENGNVFSIRARDVSPEHLYIQSAQLNKKSYFNNYIRHEQIMNGGELVFVMGERPNKNWGNREGDIPPPDVPPLSVTPVPYFASGNRTFTRQTMIRLAHPDRRAGIFYRMDTGHTNEDYQPYTVPVRITESATVSAFARLGENNSSPVIRGVFTKIPGGRTIRIISRYNPQYTAGGDDGLIDGIRGGDNFRTGYWQGYQGTDFEAIVDLGKVQPVRSVGGGFLQDIRSWIWMPTRMEVWTSLDGKEYWNRGMIVNTVPDDRYGVVVKDFVKEYQNLRARFVKLTARNYGTLPEWHPGAGGEAFIFIDEIIIR